MKRVATYTLGALLAVVAVIGLAELTQNRPDPVDPNSTSEIVVHVRTKDFDTTLAAQGLLAACQQTIDDSLPIGPVQAVVGQEDVFSMVVQPGLGEHSRRRLEGCLQDGTIPRVRGDVISISEAEAP